MSINADDHITGYYVRAWHAGKIQSIDIVFLTEDEIHDLFKDTPPKKLRNWIIALTSWIREHR
jgi:hypothetical protein